MNIDRLQDWLYSAQQNLSKHGAKVWVTQRNVFDMNPNIVLNIESDTIFATICIWSDLQEAELHAMSINSDDPLVLDRVQINDNNFDVKFQSILQLFEM